MEIFGITDSRYRTARQLGVSDPRALKRLVQEHNLNYGTPGDETAKWYILSGSYGYKLTNDFDEIEDDISRRETNVKKALQRLEKQRTSLVKLRYKSAMGELV